MGPAGIALSMALLLGADTARPITPVLAVQPGIESGAQGREDPWFGEDKYRHFFLSFAGATLTYGIASSVMEYDAAALLALGAGAAAGLGKETVDRRAGRGFSLRDLAWDGLGLVAAYALIRNTR